MWPAIQTTRDILAGDHAAILSATAWYDGAVTRPSLDVLGATYTSTLDANLVRTTLDLTVDDDEGRLVPYQGADPLAPHGQQVGASVLVTAAGDSDAVPLGRFIIGRSTPSGSWASYLGRMLPTGGTVTLQTQDILQDLIESEIPGLMQPRSSSIASEVRRLCKGITPVDTSGLSGTIDAATKAAVYDPVRLTAILSLVDADVIVRASRDGLAEFVPLPTVSSKDVTVAAGEWVAAVMEMDRDGVVNTVVTTSDAAPDRITGIASETTGPLRATGPLKPRIMRHSSPLYTTRTRAMAGAARRLRGVIAERSLPVTAILPFDPCVDAGDLHRVSLVPGSLEPLGRVRQVRWTIGEADMQITYSVARQEVEAWTRRPDLRPS